MLKNSQGGEPRHLVDTAGVLSQVLAELDSTGAYHFNGS
jgi:hypothetical protein